MFLFIHLWQLIELSLTEAHGPLYHSELLNSVSKFLCLSDILFCDRWQHPAYQVTFLKVNVSGSTVKSTWLSFGAEKISVLLCPLYYINSDFLLYMECQFLDTVP